MIDRAARSAHSPRPSRTSRRDLDRLAARGGPVPRRLERAAIDRPPRPQDVREWWAELAEPERRRLERDASLLIGNLDGVPWPARIRANHATLARVLDGSEVPRTLGLEQPVRVRPGAAPTRVGRIRERLAALRRGGSTAAPAPSRSERLRARLELLQSGAGFFDRGTLPRFLLAFDPERLAAVEYLGPAIAETDDPFASPLADGVEALGVFVPGNDSDLLQFEGKGHTMSEPVLLANARAGRTVAGMIAWQGGRFPSGPGAILARPAERLAGPLARFVNAIPRDPGVPVTAFGFSFGGAVVGRALARGMRVDRVVHVSSAGLGHGVRSLRDLPMSARVPHYAMLAPSDVTVGPIQGLDVRAPLLGGVGHGASPLRAPGVTRLETGWVDDAAKSGPLLRGHKTMLETWGTTAKHGMAAVLAGGVAEAAAPRGRLARLAERFGLPWSPLRAPGYVRRQLEIPASPVQPAEQPPHGERRPSSRHAAS